ncbi:MAG: cupin domain-containing protein [Coleofasciculaceae cyanobacterium]
MNYEQFCELAALYALDVLDEQERQLVEDYIAQFPEHQNELDGFGDAVTAMGYGVPEVMLPANLKERLFERIADEASEPNIDVRPIPPIAADLPLFTVRAADLKWEPHRVPGVTVAKLYEDPVKRELVCLLRAEPGVYYPAHRHATAEEIFMLEGDLAIDEQVYGKGDYIRSAPGSIHSPYTPNGCMFFIRTSLDNEILN